MSSYQNATENKSTIFLIIPESIHGNRFLNRSSPLPTGNKCPNNATTQTIPININQDVDETAKTPENPVSGPETIKFSTTKNVLRETNVKTCVVNRSIDTPALYRSKFIHIALWAYVTRARSDGCQIQRAIIDFQDHMNLEHIPYPTLYMAYFRMNKRFVTCKRTDAHFKRIDRDIEYFNNFCTNGESTAK